MKYLVPNWEAMKERGMKEDHWNRFIKNCLALAEDIEKNGLRHPIDVWYAKDRKYFPIGDGNHRFFAVVMLGHKTIKCRVHLPDSSSEW